MLILDLWGISFHPVVVVGLGNDLLFNFTVGHCGMGNVPIETNEDTDRVAPSKNLGVYSIHLERT